MVDPKAWPFNAQGESFVEGLWDKPLKGITPEYFTLRVQDAAIEAMRERREAPARRFRQALQGCE